MGNDYQEIINTASVYIVLLESLFAQTSFHMVEEIWPREGGAQSYAFSRGTEYTSHVASPSIPGVNILRLGKIGQ